MIRRARRDGRAATGNEGREKRGLSNGSRERIEKREREKLQFEEEGLRDPPFYRIF